MGMCKLTSSHELTISRNIPPIGEPAGRRDDIRDGLWDVDDTFSSVLHINVFSSPDVAFVTISSDFLVIGLLDFVTIPRS
jgi:hypothetical protein